MSLPRSMKATVLVAPHRFELEERPVPEPGPEDALVRRCENCIRGFYTACLNYGNRRRGHRANGFTTNGGLAEYAVNHVNTLYKIPDHVSYDEAVVVMTAGSPLYGLQVSGGYFAGETVAVLGPGPISLMALQLVKALGAVRVILTGTRASRLALGKELGADLTVNAREEDPVAAVRQATDGKGADTVIDCAGGDETFDQAIKMAKPAGRFTPSTAVLMSGMLLQGVTPGPFLLRDHPQVFWSIIGSLYDGNVAARAEPAAGRPVRAGPPSLRAT